MAQSELRKQGITEEMNGSEHSKKREKEMEGGKRTPAERNY